GDSTDYGVPGSELYSTTFGFDVQVGLPQVLIVDDDRGEDYEQVYAGILYNLRIPWAVWHKNTEGSPSGTELAKYPIVFWHTGDSAANVLNRDDIDAMKYYFDRGGNILLSTLSGAIDLDALDPDFMSNYLGASLDGAFFCPRISGVTDNPISDGTQYTYQSDASNELQQLLIPANGGEAAMTLLIEDDICGVTYQGTHSAVFLTFPVEYLDDSRTEYGFANRQTLISEIIEMFGSIPTGVDDGRNYAPLPRNFDLCQNYPNPFNPITTISYTVRPTTSALPKTNLTIYNMLGQKVITLVDKIQLPGQHSVVWYGTNSNDQPVSTGVYFYRLTRGDDSESKKMILLK
ncbi:MAG: T9SS type A sorting domain-containing protein, partial [candidate division Zixibacteria bacterium]|nr:T9SS type A sorting domain-containing protein [candidate division Zixibacteria bacterium]